MKARVTTIDLEVMGAAGAVASYLIWPREGEDFILIDPGPGSSVQTLLQKLEDLEVRPEQIRHVLATHIHLDHVGAVGQFVRQFGSTVYVHSRGGLHLARPERLMESVRQIYGVMTDELWGEFVAVPRENIKIIDDGTVLELAGHTIRAIYTPGHAVHHLAFQLEDSIFAGDVGGARLDGSDIVLAPTTPPDIHFGDWRASIAKLRALHPARLFIGHFGEIDDPPLHFSRLETNLNELEAMSLEAMRSGEGREGIARRMRNLFSPEMAQATGTMVGARYELISPFGVAAAGLERYWLKYHPELVRSA